MLAKLRNDSFRLIIMLIAHVENVDPLTGMQSAYVRSDVRRVLRAIRAVRTVEPRQLAALELEMIIQIVLAREYVATLVARVTPLLVHFIGIADALLSRLRVISLHDGRWNL